jgi:hypothetical protein
VPIVIMDEALQIETTAMLGGQVLFQLFQHSQSGTKKGKKLLIPHIVTVALSATKNFVACFQIIERMESRGLQPNSYCFEPLLRHYNPTEVIDRTLALMIDRKTPFDPIYEKTFARLTQTSTVKLIQQYKAVVSKENHSSE